MIEFIKAAVTISVMASCRIGHFVDGSEALTPADEAHHVDKWEFTVPFVCGATNLGEALRRVSEGAAMIRLKGEADSAELYDWAKRPKAPVELVKEVAASAWLPVPLFCAGGIATPTDASLVMQLGAEAVFVSSGIFKSENPSARARAIVEATTHYATAEVITKVSCGLGGAMPGAEIDKLETRLADRGC